jgi:hypothetical protein
LAQKAGVERIKFKEEKGSKAEGKTVERQKGRRAKKAERQKSRKAE